MLCALLASLFVVGNNDNFYLKQYVKNNTIHYTGMEMTPLLRATDLLQDYLNDDIDRLDMTVEKWGEEKELFDNREKTHMIDVKVMYMTFEKIMYGLGLAALAGFVYLWYSDRDMKKIAKGFNFALGVTVVFCMFFGAVFTVGFGKFWTLFHKIMFTNDLWLLDPKISTMINMFPLNFWLAMCSQALVMFAVVFGLTYRAVTLLSRRKV